MTNLIHFRDASTGYCAGKAGTILGTHDIGLGITGPAPGPERSW